MHRINKSIRTVLVVEDYDDVRAMLRLLLESERFRVLEASNGPEALTVTKSERPDVILMDLALPGFDGFETIRRIRQIDGFQNTPIIVLTAYSGEAIHETAFTAGANHFLAKPVDFEELSELLKRISVDENSKAARYNRPAAQRAMFRKDAPLPVALREVSWPLN